MFDDDDDDAVAELGCGHEPVRGYTVGFDVREDVEEIDSACSMRTTIEERDPDAADVDEVGCRISDCENYHERVAKRLRRSAACHTGNP
jgi:hypothetical protein